MKLKKRLQEVNFLQTVHLLIIKFKKSFFLIQYMGQKFTKEYIKTKFFKNLLFKPISIYLIYPSS